MKKKVMALCLSLMAVIGIAAASILVSANYSQKDPDSERVETVENEEVSTETEATMPPMFMDGESEYETVSDEQYTYYLDKESTPVYITAKDLMTMPVVTPKSDSFGEAEAARKAEELFDKTFPEAVKVEGREKEIVVREGQTWLVTIRLLEDGYDTGYCASLDFTAEGKLLASTFARGEEERPEILITKEQALQLAKEALIKDCRERYGEKVVLHFEQARDVTCEYRVVAKEGKHYWQIESFIPTENMVYWGNYELYSLIMIDAQTGECLAIATPLK